MRSETDAYKAQRRGWVTKPTLFARAFFVRKAGEAAQYAFARDFASHPVRAPYNEVVMLDAPSGYWRLDEITGTVAADSSGFGNNGQYQGLWVPGREGAIYGDPDFSTLFFDQQGMVQLPTAFNPIGVSGQPYTIECWFYITGPAFDGGTNNELFSCETFQTSGVILRVNVSNNPTSIILRHSQAGASTLMTYTLPALITTNIWYHIAATYDGTTGRIYLNGAEVAAGLLTAPVAPASGNPYIAGNSAQKFEGRIDEFAIWKGAALSAARIKAHYLSGLGDIAGGMAAGKLVCVQDCRPQPQAADPISGRSSIGTLELDLVDVNREILHQVADPARPLALPIRGAPSIRNSFRVGNFVADRILYGSTWTQSGFASFTAGRMNDGDRDTLIAFDADAAAAGSTLQLDLGASSANWKAFVSVVVFSAGGVDNCTFAIESSDDAATWTTLDTAFTTGLKKVKGRNFAYSGIRRYWRLRKLNGALAGPDYYEVQFSELLQGRNAVVQVDDVAGYPPVGHLTLETEAQTEDLEYSAIDTTLKTFTIVTRGARATSKISHNQATLVRNGEQLRRGTRLTLFLGYQPMIETQYGPAAGYQTMEVQSVRSKTLAVYSIVCSDIQRFTKRNIFEDATPANPTSLGPSHPIDIGLQVILSTGVATNGPYDILGKATGAGVPQSLIDVAAFEKIRSETPGLLWEFSEREPQEAKRWFETQILRPMMLLPDVNQAGQYTARRIATPLFRRSGYAVSGVFVGG